MKSSIVLALAIAGFVVIAASRGALDQPAAMAAGPSADAAVSITDDDRDGAMFSVAGMTPGETVQRCIVVTYTGNEVPTDVSLFGTSTGNGLAAFLELTIEEGTGGTFDDCGGITIDQTLFSGTLAAFAAEHTDFATGLRGWAPAATTESRTHRFTVTLRDDNAAQGLRADATFTWEAMSR